MKKNKSSLLIVLLLVALSAVLYILQLIVFHDSRDTAFYVLQDFAFLPLQIAIVTVVLGRYLKNREKTARLGKLNMVINAFFSEAGTELLIKLTEFNRNCDEIRPSLDVQFDWNERSFSRAINYLENADLIVECSTNGLESLKALLKSKRDFLIRMIENPNLLEHDKFTDMLLALFHITEELIARSEFDDENRTDMAHLSNDIKRALSTLLIQWVEHLQHLRSEYPYLYSLEVRRNPFCKDVSVTIRD